MISARDKFYLFFEEIIMKDFPKVGLLAKDKSRFMKILGSVIAVFNKEFMKQYVTVLRNTIYFPSKQWLEADYERAFGILAHEYVHMVDRKQKPPFIFELQYIFPQVLSVFGLLSFLFMIHPLFGLFSLFFLALFPLPSPWRLKYEINGYAMNAWINSRIGGFNLEKFSMHVAELLSGSEYYYPAYSVFLVQEQFVREYAHLPIEHPAFQKVKQWLDQLEK